MRNDLGHRIRQLRQARGLSQPALGKRARLSAVSVSTIECGKTDPHVSVVRRLAAALKVRPGDLLN
jgi:transcriptional regulator with XRE-family HTH domain